jgi:hypothetical protein
MAFITLCYIPLPYYPMILIYLYSSEIPNTDFRHEHSEKATFIRSSASVDTVVNISGYSCFIALDQMLIQYSHSLCIGSLQIDSLP